MHHTGVAAQQAVTRTAQIATVSDVPMIYRSTYRGVYDYEDRARCSDKFQYPS